MQQNVPTRTASIVALTMHPTAITVHKEEEKPGATANANGDLADVAQDSIEYRAGVKIQFNA